MFKRLAVAVIGAAILLGAWLTPSQAQVFIVSTCGTVPSSQATLTAGNAGMMFIDTTGKLCTAASVSATVTGFTPGGTFATLTATNASASVALPAGTTVAFQNTGTTTVSCTLGVGSATAVASQIQVPASSTVFVTPGSNTFGACIDQTGSASNLIVLAGGSGLGTGFGGGGGGSGGGLSVIDQAAFTQGTSAFTPSGGVFNDASTLSSGQQGSHRLTTKRAQIVDVDSSGSQLHSDLTGAIPCLNATAFNTNPYTTGQTNPSNCDLNGNLYVHPPANQSVNQTQIGGVAAVADPCQTATKIYTPINVVTATNTIITGVAAKKKYICGIFLYPAGTDNIAIFQATTATACVTALVGVIGGTTTATGIVATAQAGFVLGNGASAVAATTVNQTDLCIVTSAAVQLSGVVVTVDQ